MLSQAKKKLQADALGGIITDVANIKENYTPRDEVQKTYATKIDVISNYATKKEVSDNYATRKEVRDNYATIKGVADTYSTKAEIQAANFAVKGDLAAYQPKGNYQPAGDYVTKKEIQAGNYASKSDLAAYQPKGNYQPVGDYATKKEIQAANYATKGDLSTYALKTDLSTYAAKTDLAAFQPKGDYALKSELAGLNPKIDLSGYQPKGDYALKGDLAGFQPKGDYSLKSDLAAFQPKGDYAAKADLAAFQPKGDYALKSELAGLNPKVDLSGYQPKGDYAVKSDLAAYQPKGDYAVKTDLAAFQPKGDYAAKTDLAAYQPKGDYAAKTDLAGYQPKGDYALKSEIPKVGSGTGPVKISDRWVLQDEGGVAVLRDVTETAKGKDSRFAFFGSKYVDVDNQAASATAVEKQTISDTRDVNLTPEQYYEKGRGTYREFKTVKAIGVPSTAAFCHLETIVNWNDPSGGPIYQYAHCSSTERYVRTSEGTGAWKREEWKNAKWGSWNSTNFIVSKNDGFRHLIQNTNNAGQLRHTLEADQNALTVATFNDDGSWNGRHPLRIQRGSGHVENWNDNKNSYSLNAWGVKDGGWGVIFKNGPDRVDDGGKKTFTVRNDDGDLRLQSNGGVVKINNNLSINDDGNGLTIKAIGGAGKDRMHVMSEDELYILNKKGVIIGKDWGGSGNLTVQGDASVGGQAYVGDNVIMTGKNSWILHTPESEDRKQLYIAPGTNGANWDWSKQTQFMADGTILSSGGINKQTISDTRDENLTPEQYYAKGRGTYREFKSKKALGVPSDVDWCHLETIVNWNDTSGGPIYQYAHCSDTERYIRTSNINQWNAWRLTTFSDYDAFSNGGDAEFSAGWDVQKGNNAWDVGIRGGAGYTGLAYTDRENDQSATDRTATIPVPAGMRSGFLFHLPWSNCRHFDIFGVLANGKEVFINRVNAYQGVKHTNVDGYHDGASIVPIPRVDRFAKIRLKGVKGRIHYMGTGWSRQIIASGNNGTGFISSENVIGTIYPGDVKGDLTVSGKIKFAEDTDWANIGIEGGANRKDLTLRWADDDDDKLRFVFKHHAREDKEVANMTKDGMNINGQLVIAPEGLKVSNPNDWQRIFGSDNYGVALYNGLSVNDNGGVMVGAWQRPPQGMILSKYSMHSFTDAGGNDIGGASLDNGTLAECKAKCDSINECKSFNFRTDRSLTDPNARGPCWIKNSASNNRAPTADWHLFTKNF